MRSGDLHRTVEARLRAVGQLYTRNRRALVEALERAGRPVSIPDLLARRRTLAQSSAYRNLGVLEQAGVVHRLVTDEEFARFELAEDLTEHHHHLVCSTCGSVEDVAVPKSFERYVERSLVRIAGRAGFSPADHRIDVIGTCRGCRSAADRDRLGGGPGPPLGIS